MKSYVKIIYAHMENYLHTYPFNYINEIATLFIIYYLYIKLILLHCKT